MIVGAASTRDLVSDHSGGAGRQAEKERRVEERILLQAELPDSPPKYRGPAMLHRGPSDALHHSSLFAFLRLTNTSSVANIPKPGGSVMSDYA